eukprot:14153881-Ditylum_brightwellii.AAC.2
MLMPAALKSVCTCVPDDRNKEKTASGASICATRQDNGDYKAREDAKRAQEDAENHKVLSYKGINKTSIEHANQLENVMNNTEKNMLVEK